MYKLSAVAVVWMSTALVAQSPATAPKPLPPNYTVELDNAYVRVTRASFKPHETVAVHLHPTFPTVYVYLTDGGPMRFIHVTPSYTVMRAPVRAGGVRYNRNWHDETHVIEYLGEVATEYLRVEMKTVPDKEHRDVRMAPDDIGPIEDAQVRVSRHQCAVNAGCARPAGPALVITVDARSFEWIQPHVIAGVVNGNAATSQIWIELKTQPDGH